MAYPAQMKEKAISLRKNGYSIKEIAKLLKIGVGTSSEWLHSIVLDEQAQKRLQNRSLLGRYRTILTFRKRREELMKRLNRKSRRIVSSQEINKNLCKIYCSLLYWAEGGKDHGFLNFTNSDIRMAALFLTLLRKAYKIDEKKLHVTLHLHEYHNEETIKALWAKEIKISYYQFNKSYLKPHTKKRKKDYYPGCMNMRYYDSKIALELYSIYNMLAEQFL